MIHVEEVILPEAVERLQHDDALDLPHHAFGEIALLRLVELPEAFDDLSRDRADAGVLALFLAERNADRELPRDRVVDRLPIPIGRRGFVVDDRGDGVLGEPLDELHHLVTQALAGEETAAARVDDLALLVHDVVVFEQVLADVEVVRLDLRLRVRDRAGDQAVLDRHAVFHAEPLHQTLDAVGAEDAEEIVFQGKEEPRRPGITLATGATAELVVDAPALVALGADDMQAADADHLLVFLGARLLVLGVHLVEATLEFLRRLFDLLADLVDRP